jgi:large subunit ribosomal protein L25
MFYIKRHLSIIYQKRKQDIYMNTALDAMKREKGTAELLRAEGKIPAVVYGPDIESQSIAIDRVTFEKMYAQAGHSTLIDLSVDGKTINVLIQDVQYHPVKHIPVHDDFRQVTMGESMQATVSLNFVGESEAVRTGGILNTQVESVEVTCLPKDLVNHIDVDLSKLATAEDTLLVRDIALPAGMELVTDGNVAIATVSMPMSDEQLAALEEENSKGVESVEDAEPAKEDASEEAEA